MSSGGLRKLAWVVVAWGGALLGTAPGVGQTTAPLPPRAELAADESTLWLAEVRSDQTRIFRRDAAESFKLAEPLYAPVATLVARDGVLYAFTVRGALYALTNGGWSRRPDLPGRHQPRALAGHFGLLYALIDSPGAGQLPRLVDGRRPVESQPFDAGAAALSLAQLDPQGWIGVAPAPVDLPASGPPPHLAVLHDEINVFTMAEGGAAVRLYTLDATRNTWRAQELALPVAADQLWFTPVNRVPTIIYQARGTAPPQLGALRLFGSGQTAEWRAAELQLSPLPDPVQPARYTAAYGFNQHVVLLMTDAAGAAWLRYGRIEAAPAERAVAAAEVMATRGLTPEGPGWIHGGALLLLLLVLLSLFLFRRGAMVAILTLPQGFALALAFQRMLTFAIDLLPFALLLGWLLRVDVQQGFQELLGWGLGSDAAAGRFPQVGTLVWWGLTVACYAAYTFLMELLVRRTVGKVVTGTRILSETGGPPRVWQVALRNLSRTLELLPPMWILLLLVVLSRNRQRLGDIFARTVVVRRVRVEAPPTPPPPTSG